MAPQSTTICGIVALLASTASTIFTLLIAIALLILRSPIWPLAIVSTILDIFVLSWIAYMLASSMGRDDEQGRRSLGTFRLIASILLSSAAALATLSSLVWIQLRPASADESIFGKDLFILQKTEYALLGTAIVLQAVFTGFWIRSQNMVRLPPQTEMRLVSPSQPEVRTPPCFPDFTPAVQVQPVTSTIQRRQSIASASTHSAESEHSKVVSSARSSFDERLRPMTSMSRLIRPHSWTPNSNIIPHEQSSSRYVAQLPIAGPAVTEWNRRGSAQSSRTRSQSDASSYSSRSSPETPYRTRLETIPGSRANSPGRPLDGPFPPATASNEQHITSSNDSRDDLLQNTSYPEEAQLRPQAQRFYTALTTPQHTPPLVNVEDESHIHPLFRTKSPIPPPNRTAGTVVIASSQGGQYMTPRTLNSATSRSRARNSLYDPSRARSHSRLGARAQQQQLPIPHTIVRARSLETLDSWQTRLEEGNDPLTIQQLAQAARPRQPIQLRNDENRPPSSTVLPVSLQVKIPQKRQSGSRTVRGTSTHGTPRRALSETSSNVRSSSSSPRRSPRKSRDTTRSSMSLKQRQRSDVPDIQIYVDPAE